MAASSITARSLLALPPPPKKKKEKRKKERKKQPLRRRNYRLMVTFLMQVKRLLAVHTRTETNIKSYFYFQC